MNNKIGPNEKCPCGSGKKYKKCCKDKIEEISRNGGSFYKKIYSDSLSILEEIRGLEKISAADISQEKINRLGKDEKALYEIIKNKEGNLFAEIIQLKVNTLEESKVFKIKTDEISDKEFSIRDFKMPFESVFLEFDNPIHIPECNLYEEDKILGIVISKSKSRKIEVEIEKLKENYKELTGEDVVPEKELEKMKKALEETNITEVEILAFSENTDRLVADYNFTCRLTDFSGIYCSTNYDESHREKCKCLESEFSESNNLRAITSLPESIANELKKIHKNVPEKCPTLKKFESIGYMAYFAVSAVNRAKIEYYEGIQKEAEYNFKGNSPIVMTVSLKSETRVKYKSTGLGTKHRYRYDVRGHFHTYNTKQGPKVIWISEYQKGQGEYIKKGYQLNQSIKVVQAQGLTIFARIKKFFNNLIK